MTHKGQRSGNTPQEKPCYMKKRGMATAAEIMKITSAAAHIVCYI
jgi:hypothetical protein